MTEMTIDYKLSHTKLYIILYEYTINWNKIKQHMLRLYCAVSEIYSDDLISETKNLTE